ncbi:hypothetical protein PTSG_07132 [Salpingoeca rosetta]|uniref:Laminin G domain-containing protein n=1 Tax=Salpingoeca rosetta (strain ATCC 50818 / BSB-021) TaxID=946362 RepID=F2UE54_SALR5|nr:uncharacterized protein PTSG_07132 [Salpingoeca rosetta]EGD74904.1 hypothetical protein PTSG_07132 [Salpingoeca rosetta]|eukprot:XP_004992549.1 hypothetical protein PTSG_07132 [Salpingoeca rosetta]
MPQLESVFSIVATVERAPGTAGYVVSLSDGNGLRYVAVFYSDISGSLLFFYTTLSGEQQSVRFSYILPAVSRRHLLLAVSQTEVSCIITDDAGEVDFESTATLASSLSPCYPLSPACVLSVGTRGAEVGPASTSWIGAISRLLLVPNVALDTPVAPLPASTTAPPTTTSTGSDGTSSILNLLDTSAPSASNATVLGTVDTAPGGGLSFGGGVVRVDNHPPTDSDAGFSIAITARQALNDNGYLFAKTNAAGDERSYGLYSSSTSNRLSFYYHTDTTGSEVVHLPVSISDGQLHQVLLTVVFANDQSQGELHLTVDEEEYDTITLAGAVVDCGAAGPDCVFYIGQRSSTTGGAFVFRGQMFQFTWRGGVEPAGDTQSLTSSLWLFSNLLLPTISNAPEDEYNSLTGDLTLDGSNGVRILDHGGFGSTFVISMRVMQLAGNNGYLFAQSDGQGFRHFSLYSSSTSNALTFYYAAQGFRTQQSVRFDVAIADSTVHTITVSVDSTRIDLRVDDQTFSAVLVGAVDDCGLEGANCFFHLGQRTSALGGAFFLRGIVLDAAAVYAHALQTI